MKTIILSALLMMSNFSFGKELSTNSVSCFSSDSLERVDLSKTKNGSINLILMDTDLNGKAEREVVKVRLSYFQNEGIYKNLSKEISLKLYKTKSQEYGVALEMAKVGYYNDMFECGNH